MSSLAHGCLQECLSAPFQRLLRVMRAQLRDSLADGLGEHVLPHLDQAEDRDWVDDTDFWQSTYVDMCVYLIMYIS